MAKAEKTKSQKSAKSKKTTKTMRQLRQASSQPNSKSHIKKVAKVAKKPLNPFIRVLKKLRIPLPNNKFGRSIRKIGRIIGRILLPGFLRNSWKEIRLVTWPGRKETFRLSVAVLIFSIIFGTIVAVLDIGLDKVFRELIIKA